MRKDKTYIMDKITYIILAMFIAMLLLSCNRSPKEALYKCKDGSTVNDFNLCPEMQQAQEEQVNQTEASEVETEEPPVNDTEEEPSSEIIRDIYKEKEENTTTGSYPSLNGWSVSEIVNGMAAYNKELLGKYPAEVLYDKYVKGYYTLGIKRVEDPFYIIRRHTSGGSREYDLNQFRIEVPVRPIKVLDEVNSKHNDSKFKIVYPQEWEEWSKIQCEKLESCRDIDAIKCVSEAGDELYMWVHSTPGEGYTTQIKYTMQAVNDQKEMLGTFEKFYCTPR